MNLKFALFTGVVMISIFAYRFAVAQSRTNAPTNIVVESIHLDPPDGSILREQTPVFATIKFRFTKPASEVGVWVRIFDDTYKSQYFGSPDSIRPGSHTVTRGAYLTEPGKLDRLTLVFKNAKAAEIYRQEIPVNYTFVADPALEEAKKVGIGSTVSNVVFPHGKRATVKKGTFIPVAFDYNINTPDGLFPGTVPETSCSVRYDGLMEPLRGKGSIQMGFIVGEACSIQRVRVAMRNAAEARVVQEYVDVDLTITD